jgi:hypothetical protein
MPYTTVEIRLNSRQVKGRNTGTKQRPGRSAHQLSGVSDAFIAAAASRLVVASHRVTPRHVPNNRRHSRHVCLRAASASSVHWDKSLARSAADDARSFLRDAKRQPRVGTCTWSRNTLKVAGIVVSWYRHLRTSTTAQLAYTPARPAHFTDHQAGWLGRSSRHKRRLAAKPRV